MLGNPVAETKLPVISFGTGESSVCRSYFHDVSILPKMEIFRCPDEFDAVKKKSTNPPAARSPVMVESFSTSISFGYNFYSFCSGIHWIPLPLSILQENLRDITWKGIPKYNAACIKKNTPTFWHTKITNKPHFSFPQVLIPRSKIHQSGPSKRVVSEKVHQTHRTGRFQMI